VSVQNSWPASVILILAMSVAVCIAACRETAAPPRFPHAVHLVGLECGKPGQRACLSCSTCHSPSQRERVHKLPDERLCARCHRDDAHELRRVLAIVPDRPYGNIRFDHDQHLRMKGVEGQCVGCHAGVVRPNQPNIPPMSQCFSCHEHEAEWNRGECTPCHSSQDLRRTMPQTFLRHDSTFMRRHGQLASLDQQLCGACHSEAQCNDCHDITQDLTFERRRPERVSRTFVHSGDFLTRHALEATSQPARCARCHTPDSCESCHLARGVSGARVNGRNPHPPGWVGSTLGAPSLHGPAARRDIYACASCHEQGPLTNCIRCHKVGGFGGNPHPRGWRSARGAGEQMCRYCHG